MLGINQMDNDDPLGIDSVAKACRRLGGKTNRGDRLLTRVRDRASLAEPALPPLTPPVRAGIEHLVFAYGAAPGAEEAEETDKTTLWTPSALEELLDARCVVLGDTHGQIEYSWHDLFSVVATKLSVHSDDEIPRYVDELCRYRIGGVPVLRAAIRTVGVMLGAYAHRILLAVNRAPEQVPPPTAPGRPWVGAAEVRIDGSKHDIRALVRVNPGELVAYDGSGSVGWLHDPPEFTGSTLVRWPAQATLGRNDPCPCGSGKKFKRCHGAPRPG